MSQNGFDSKLHSYLTTVVFVGTASKDVTTNIVKRLAQLGGDATKSLKALIVSAGGSN